MGSAPLAITLHRNAVQHCDEILQWLEQQQEWDRSTIFGANRETLVDEHRTSSTASFPLLSFLNPWHVHEMNAVVWRALDAYARQWNFSFVDVESVSVQRYEPGQKYGVHMDAGPGVPRVCSALVYLNTVEAGGETYFPHFDYKVTPEQGTLVIFPANYVYAHAALPPESGMKYAAAYWARG